MLWIIPFLLAAAPQDPPEVGTWRTVNEKTHVVTSTVRITVDEAGKLSGRVVQVLNPDVAPHPLCDQCEGDRHNQPVEGMVILWDMVRDGDAWGDGRILDPGDGKIYRCKLHAEGADKLEVRGYIGFALLGRTQIWERVIAGAATAAPADPNHAVKAPTSP